MSDARFVLDALRARWNDLEGEWLFFEEPFRIDAFAVRCWQSGIGNRRIAFEVKVSRRDFLLEIKRPEKRRNAVELSHQFFFATPKGLVRPAEIPPECGLVEVDGNGRTRTVVRAPVREARALLMSEAIYLMRKGIYAGGVLQLRREAIQEAAWRRSAEILAENARAEVTAAEGLLERHAGHLVVKGSEWVGAWQPHSWRPPVGRTAVYVEKVERTVNRDGSEWTRIVVRRLDGKDDWPWTFYRAGEFLRRFSPAADVGSPG